MAVPGTPTCCAAASEADRSALHPVDPVLARIQRTRGRPALHPVDPGLPWAPCALDCALSVEAGGRRLEAPLELRIPEDRPLFVRRLDPEAPVGLRPVRVVVLDLPREETDFAGSVELQFAAADLARTGHRAELVRLTTGFTGARLAEVVPELVTWLVDRGVELVAARNHVTDALPAALGAAGIRTVYLDSVAYRGRLPPEGLYDRVQAGDDRTGLLAAADALARGATLAPRGPIPGAGIDRVIPDSFLVSEHYWPAVRYYDYISGRPRPLPRHLLVHAWGCPWGADVADNPAYAGVPLGSGIKRAGCAYCGIGGDYQRLPVPDYVGFLAHQIRWLAEHAPGAEVVVADEATFSFLDRLVARLAAERGPRPGPLLIKARMNGLIPTLDRFEQALDQARAAGIEVVCYLLGIENFSDAELVRYNKGISAKDLISGLHRLLDLERRFPGTFSFTRYNAHGFILYNPWTTVADLRINERVFRELGIRRLSGKAIWSRLRMYPWQPLAALARRDGLLDDTGRFARLARREVGYHDDELGWRFADPVVERCYALVSRAMDAIPAVDEVGLELFSAALDQAGSGGAARAAVDELDREFEAFRERSAALFAGGPGLRQARDRVERALAELARRSPSLRWRVAGVAPEGPGWTVSLEGPGAGLVGRVPVGGGPIRWDPPTSRAAALLARALDLAGRPS